MKSSTSIGTLDWSGCCECQHSDEEKGGCDIKDSIFEANITIHYDEVLCGCFKSVYDNSIALNPLQENFIL